MSTPVKVAIVTGAGTGVGKRTALALLEVGYSVALAGRRVEPLESTVAAAGPAASRALVVPTDVGDPDLKGDKDITLNVERINSMAVTLASTLGVEFIEREPITHKYY